MIVLLTIILLVASVITFNRVLPGLLTALFLLIALEVYAGVNATSLFIYGGNAMLITIELTLLILGSISFYRLLEQAGHFKDFSSRLQSRYDQVDILLLMTWFLCTFFEGVAGFGVPALLIAPLMISLGYKPLSTVVLLLSANTLSVCYGALGTPVKIGLAISSPTHPFNLALSAELFPLMLIMPFWLIVLASILEPQKVKLKWHIVPFALLAGLIPASVLFLFSHFSIEFPSVIAGLSGFIIYLLIRTRWSDLKTESIFWFNFFKPYLLLVIVLFIARHAIGYANVELIYGLRQVAIYQPGALIVLFSLVWIFFQRKQNLDVSVFTQILSSSFQKSRWTLFTILLLVFLSGMLRKPVSELILSLGLSESLIILVSPFAGVLGSFTTGSLTMSNLLLHQAFESVLSQPDNLLQVIVLLHIGGALGNAISLQNIVMVNAVLPKRAPLKKVIGWNVMSVSVFVVLLLLTYLLFGS